MLMRRAPGDNGCPLRCQYMLESCASLPWNRHFKLCWEQAAWLAYDFEPDNPNDDPKDLVPAHRTIARQALCDLHYQASDRRTQRQFEPWDAETFYLGRKSNYQQIAGRKL